MYKKNFKITTIFYLVISLFFLAFIVAPLFLLFIYTFKSEEGVGLANYITVITDKGIIRSLINSIKVSSLTALITTVIAFILAYTINCTKILEPIKNIIKTGILIPMLLPTITYGFSIIYSFGKQGLLTKFLGREIMQIYGFNGLLLGYVIYTLPSAFLIINNSFKYIDKKFIIVSKLMGDSTFRSFANTVVRPLIGTLGGAFVLSFILSFTDYGIPASIGGTYSVIPTYLYEVMLGSIPNFNTGSVIAILMLLPAGLGVFLLSFLEKFNFHYDKSSKTELTNNLFRDISLGVISVLIMVGIVTIFLVMFIAPFVQNFPYDMAFTTEFVRDTLFSRNILNLYKNSIMVGVFTAFIGTFISYVAALLNVRTKINPNAKLSIDIISMITNTVPGMVLGLSYLMLFNGSNLKGTFFILIICNMVHFFTTPYLMAKNSFLKMNPSWETIAELLGDTFIKTVLRIIIPSSISTIVEMISYYFINSMVTISAIIFLVTARTSTLTSKIKEYQHFENFNQIFVLSIFIFLTNMVIKVVCDIVIKKLSRHQ